MLNETYTQFTAIETRIEGRIGVYAQRVGTKHCIEHRCNERFLMFSVFKLPLVGHILEQVDRSLITLGQIVTFGPSDLLEYSPITSKNVHLQGMSVGDLCTAALQHSDNTAANLLLKLQNGPLGLTTYIRALGDHFTRSDRIEPFLNDPLEDYDTTTPAAIVKTVSQLVIGEALSDPMRKQLEQWLLGNLTGFNRLRAGLPSSWHVGDKTGTGSNGITNDVGILYPPSGSPIVVATFVADTRAGRVECEAAIADIARIVSMQLDGIVEAV